MNAYSPTADRRPSPLAPHAPSLDGPAAPALTAQGLELRVLCGPQAGARIDWPAAGQCLTLAAGDLADLAPADLLLESGQAVHLRLRATPAGDARCEVLEGTVWCGDAAHQAGARFVWSPCVPLQLGPSLAVAYGDAAMPMWSLQSAESQDDAPADPPAASATTAAPPAPAPRSRLEPWLAGGGALLGVAGLVWSLVVTLPGAATSPSPAAVVPWDALQAVLRDPTFSGVSFERLASGDTVLQGRLATRAQEQQLRARMAAWPAQPQWQVQVDEALAAQVEDTLQVQGLAWRAVVTGPGTVRLEGDAGQVSPDRLARVLADTRAALPQLRQVVPPAMVDVAVLEREPPAAGPPAAPSNGPPTLPAAGSEPGKRIVTLVSHGALPHLVTADGARYFVGAVLPSGHRLAGVSPQALVLERDGRETRIDF